jgi:hypothetical protein
LSTYSGQYLNFRKEGATAPRNRPYAHSKGHNSQNIPRKQTGSETASPGSFKHYQKIPNKRLDIRLVCRHIWPFLLMFCERLVALDLSIWQNCSFCLIFTPRWDRLVVRNHLLLLHITELSK